jgi:uncharacterized protein (TIGR02118 family)
MVVVYRRPELTAEQFCRHMRDTHGPLAMSLPGMRKYVQNFVSKDATRQPPGWDAIVELYFEDRPSMEAAWASPQGAASDADLAVFADLTRTTWSVVDEVTVLE